MKKLIVSMACSLILFNKCAQKTEFYSSLPTEKDLNESAHITGHPTIKSPIATLIKFNRFGDERIKYHLRLVNISNIDTLTSSLVKHHKEYFQLGNSLPIDFSIKENPKFCKKFVQHFFICCLLTQLINKILTPPFNATNNHTINIAGSLEVPAGETNDFIEYVLFRNKLFTLLGSYQQFNNPDIFTVIVNLTIFALQQKFNTQYLSVYPHTLKCLSQSLGEMYNILIQNILLSLEIVTDTYSSKDPISLKFLKKEIKKMAFFYFITQTQTGNIQEAKKLFISMLLKSLGDSYKLGDFYKKGANDFISYDLRTFQLHVTITEEFKEFYCDVYNVATNNNQNPLSIRLEDFWSGEVSLTITPDIPGIIEGYVTPVAIEHQQLGTRIEQEIVSTTKKVEKMLKGEEKKIKKEVKEIMEKVGLKDTPSTPLSTSSSKKKSAIATLGKKESAYAEKPSPEESLQDTDDRASSSFTTSFYTFNNDLSNKKIELAQRIQDWYVTTPEGISLALKKQGYLTPGTDRHSLFEQIKTRYRSNDQQAIQEIVFTHQLPYSLIHSIVSYGIKSNNSLGNEITLVALVCLKKEDKKNILPRRD